MQIKRASVKTARAIAAMLTAASPVAGAFPAAAQQMALGADFSQCDKIKDPAKSAQCVYDTDIAHSKARIAAAAVRLAAVDQNIDCAKFLLVKKSEGVVIDPTRANFVKGCAYARELGMK